MTRKVILKERKAPPAKRFGDEIHTDLWGPSPINSLGGCRYYITFTDDATDSQSSMFYAPRTRLSTPTKLSHLGRKLSTGRKSKHFAPTVPGW